jgi:hypothetical protein
MSRPDVPRYSRVPEAFWMWSVSWPDEMKIAALYFMTSPHRTMEGIFLLPVGYATADLQWTPKKVSKAITFLTEQDFLRFDPTTSTLLLKDALKWQAPENENQAKSCLRRIANLPNTALLGEFLLLAKQHCCQKGSSLYAQTFYEMLEQQEKRTPQPLGQHQQATLEPSGEQSPTEKNPTITRSVGTTVTPRVSRAVGQTVRPS